jgi:hypothetical protein
LCHTIKPAIAAISTKTPTMDPTIIPMGYDFFMNDNGGTVLSKTLGGNLVAAALAFILYAINNAAVPLPEVNRDCKALIVSAFVILLML